MGIFIQFDDRELFHLGNYEYRDPNVAVHYLTGKRRLVEDYPTVVPQIS